MSIYESRGPIAILPFPASKSALLTSAKAILLAVTNNPYFPNPNPSVAQLEADIAAFEGAETRAATKAKGTKAESDAKKKKLKDGFRHLCDYVQGVAEAQSSPADAIAVITSAQMTVRKPPTRSKPELAAKNNGSPGTVRLSARAVARPATYYWQYSQDQITWTDADATLKSYTEITGLTQAQIYAFRFWALTPAGKTDHSQVITLLVH